MAGIKTRIVNRLRITQAMNRIPLIGGFNMEVRPQAELVLRKEGTQGRPLPFATEFYKTGGVKVFMGVLKCGKDVVDSQGNVVFRKGERFLSPHIIGNDKRGIITAIQETVELIRSKKKELEEAGISGIIFEPGSETYFKRAKKMGGREVEPSKLHKAFTPYVLKFMGQFFPSNMPRIENINMRRIALRLKDI